MKYKMSAYYKRVFMKSLHSQREWESERWGTISWLCRGSHVNVANGFTIRLSEWKQNGCPITKGKVHQNNRPLLTVPTESNCSYKNQLNHTRTNKPIRECWEPQTFHLHWKWVQGHSPPHIDLQLSSLVRIWYSRETTSEFEPVYTHTNPSGTNWMYTM